MSGTIWIPPYQVLWERRFFYQYLKSYRKPSKTWGICQGYAKVYILVLKPYILLSSPGPSSNDTARCQYFLCIHPFPQCFYSPPNEYILPFYFLLSSLFFTSFFSHFFLFFYNFFTFLVVFSNCFPQAVLNFGICFVKRGLKK